jgi:hypothetical protein
LSHADEDKLVARRLADELSKFGFDMFVAHDDIILGDEWEQTLKNEIEKRELFIALLSDNFRKAHFTDHEIGIATAYNKRIFPIRIDDTMPYGFMSKFQGSKKINPNMNVNEMENLAHMLTSFTNETQKVIDELIKNLQYAQSFREANALANKLFECRTFTKKQINDIAKIFLDNHEVRGSWTAGPSTLEFLANNWTSVKAEYQNELKKHLQRE